MRRRICVIIITAIMFTNYNIASSQLNSIELVNQYEYGRSECVPCSIAMAYNIAGVPYDSVQGIRRDITDTVGVGVNTSDMWAYMRETGFFTRSRYYDYDNFSMLIKDNNMFLCIVYIELMSEEMIDYGPSKGVHCVLVISFNGTLLLLDPINSECKVVSGKDLFNALSTKHKYLYFFNGAQ